MILASKMPIIITLPFLPISKSNGYKTGKGRMFKGKDIKDQEALIVIAATKALPVDWVVSEKPIKITAVFYYADKRRRDLDNHMKLLLDCFNKLIFKDDSQIIEIHIKKILGNKLPMTTVLIEEL
jgi:Holliday junction resolvase RusA-like endonuclease